jgi:8-oxo-dGTP pyrophosphatase MutT (NUDIX family)
MNDEVILAATLILLRDRIGASPDILMLKRGEQLSFAGGAMVFPGGKIDRDDALIAADEGVLIAGPALDPLDAAARVAAIRETIEEVGLAPAVAGVVDPGMIAAIRKRLANRESFPAILRDLKLRLDLHLLHPFSRWMPPVRRGRRFDTFFYIARAPDHDHAIVDGSESSSCYWETAASHIAQAETGARTMIFPTLCNLARIGQTENFDEAVAFAARYPIETICPIQEERDGVRWVTIPDHLGYPITTGTAPRNLHSRGT